MDQEKDYICSKPEDHGMHLCSDIPPYKIGNITCMAAAPPRAVYSLLKDEVSANDSCINWNLYYTDCRIGGNNPFQGTISFDNIGLAWVAIFLVSGCACCACCARCAGRQEATASIFSELPARAARFTAPT